MTPRDGSAASPFLVDCQGLPRPHPRRTMFPPSPSARPRRLAVRMAKLVAAVVVGTLLVAIAVAVALRASLPSLDGRAHLPGLEHVEASIERDHEGHVTIRAGSRADAARALGYAHAQDRFFQMDLLRRAGQGRLSEIVGPAAIDTDRQARRFRGGAAAAAALQRLPEDERVVLRAYAEGVNAALQHLTIPPPEYLALRVTPQPWTPEDSLVLNLTFSFLLQDPEARIDRDRSLLRQAIGPRAYAFYHPRASHLDAPLDHHVAPDPPIPAPDAFTLPRPPLADAASVPGHADDESVGSPTLGSNAWAVHGGLTRSGAALVADDMHLGISVPGVWYRAVLRWTQPDGRERMLAGVTVPGAPTVITGSNGDVAWGFTNAMLDTSDLIDLRLDPAKPGQYLTPDGWQPFAIHDEPIQVAHAPTLPHRVTNTVWGPVLGAAPSGAIHAVAWVMARPEALAANSLALENATNVAQAIHAAHRSARPVQNFVAGDRSGAIAWTLVGTLPDRDAGTGEFAEDWSQPKAPWRGLLPAERRPVVMNPEGGRIWTANQRILGSPAYLALGDGGWDLGARASCIRDRLTALQKATPADMLAIQLDDTIPMLRPWHRRLVAVASSLASKAHPTNAVAWSNLLAQLRPWDGRAAADSLAVPAIARFRHHAINLLYEPIGWALGEANSMDSADAHPYFHFQFSPGMQSEGAAERLLAHQPRHLLNPRHASYDDLLAEAARRALMVGQDGRPAPLRPWGTINRTRFRHRLSDALPGWLARWLDLPSDPQGGFHYGLPRIAGPNFGASQRFGIEPGDEANAYLHTPAGQSGHFLSPFYRNSHPDWLHGRPTPLLGHPPAHRLVLSSRKG